MIAADPCFLTVTEAAALIRDKKLSPVELTRAYLDRIERLNGRLHAYVRVLHEEALGAAALELLLPFLDDRENPRHRKLRLIGVRAEKLAR